jgi:molybdopterin molybdotransferase
VLLQEDTAREGEQLRLTGTPPSPQAKHIRRKGLDFDHDQFLLPAGAKIGPAQIALALAAGHSHLPVRRSPRVCVIDSGDELAPSGSPCAPHQIPASNGAMLAAMIAAVASRPTRIGPVADDLAALLAAFDDAQDADVIVTSGGASVGDHDLIRPALEQWGAKLDFWRVAIRPGKPLLVARREQQIIIGLPGNPVSSLVTGYFFLLPLLRAMLGASDPLPTAITASLAEGLPQGADRREFIRGMWDGQSVAPRLMRDSSALAAMASSNCLIERPARAQAAQKGDAARIYLLGNGGII